MEPMKIIASNPRKETPFDLVSRPFIFRNREEVCPFSLLFSITRPLTLFVRCWIDERGGVSSKKNTPCLGVNDESTN